MNVALTNARFTARREAAAPTARTPPDQWPRRHSSSRTKTSWWLWPHLLSLDAPLVALVWQRWWAHAAGVTLPASREVILGLGVWLIYLADRLADAVDHERREHGAARHVFSGAHRHVLLPLAVAVALGLAALAPCCLPAAEFRAGMVFLLLAMGYFWLTHGWPGRRWAAYVPKEAVVGTMFGAGSAFFVVCRSAHTPGVFWLGLGLFGMVCFLNCALITGWERHPHDLRERSSLLNAFPRLSGQLSLICVLVAGLAVAGRSVLTMPIAASALLLAMLDHCRNRVSTDTLRVLADVTLLTPCLLLI